MDFNSRPIWAGAVLLLPDNRIYAFQVNRPEARIEVQYEYQRYGSWNIAQRFTPMHSTIEINLKGDAYYWDPDGSSGERLANVALTQDWGTIGALEA